MARLEAAESSGGSVRDPRRAYRVVDAFEDELADYCGSPYAVTVDSCSNALLLAFAFERFTRGTDRVTLPKRTYVGVLQAALNAGLEVDWSDEEWTGEYGIEPTNIVDSARHFGRDIYGLGDLRCLSFHAAKQLPLGRGGAILCGWEDAAIWLRAARMDGRPPGAPIEATQFPGFHCPLPPDTAARGLWILSRWNDSGYEPAPLVPEQYPDLSTLMAVA